MTGRVHGEQRARCIVDDRGEVAHVGAFRGMAGLQRLERMVQGLPENVETAAARVRKALRIILEANGFDEPGDEEVGPSDEVPQAAKGRQRNQCGDDKAGAHAGRFRGFDDQQDGGDEDGRAPGESELELAPKVHASPCAGRALRG
jgi:hypothetical protein